MKWTDALKLTDDLQKTVSKKIENHEGEPGQSPYDKYIYVLKDDGYMMEHPDPGIPFMKIPFGFIYEGYRANIAFMIFCFLDGVK